MWFNPLKMAAYSLFMNQLDDDSDDDYELEEDIALFLYFRQKQYDPGYFLRQKARNKRAFYDTLTMDEKRKRRMSIPVSALRPVCKEETGKNYNGTVLVDFTKKNME